MRTLIERTDTLQDAVRLFYGRSSSERLIILKEAMEGKVAEEYDYLVHFFETEFVELQTKFYEVAIMPLLVLIDELNFIEDNKKMRLGCQTSCSNKILKYTIAPLKQRGVLYDNICNLDQEFCQFSLGIEEKIVGIKEKPFLNNPQIQESPSFLEYKEGRFQGYNTLKTTYLKFPESKDFDIKYIEDRNKNGVIDPNENQRISIFDQSTFNQGQKPPQVPENVNVFIKELKRSYANEIGGLNPVIFYFEVW